MVTSYEDRRKAMRWAAVAWFVTGWHVVWMTQDFAAGDWWWAALDAVAISCGIWAGVVSSAASVGGRD